MTYTRRYILNETDPDNLLYALDDVQNGILTGVFDTIENMSASGTVAYLLPVSAMISSYKLYRDWKHFKREKNKNLRKKTQFGINVLSTTGEIIAAGAVVSAYLGTQLVAAPIISALFFGSIAIKFVSHFTQTIYHGFKWALAESGTKKNEMHKNFFWKNLRKTSVLGVVGTTIGLLAVTPAFHLATLSIGFLIGVKAIGMSIIGLDIAKTARDDIKQRQQKKKQHEIWHKKSKEFRAKRIGARQQLKQKEMEKRQSANASSLVEKKDQKTTLNKQPSNLNILRKLSSFVCSEDLVRQAVGLKYDEPVTYDKTRADFGPDAKLRIKYQGDRHQSLRDDDVDDLIRKLESTDEIDGPKKNLLILLRQPVNDILACLNVEKNHQVKLNNEGHLPALQYKGFSLNQLIQNKIELLDKLHAVLLLEALVEKGFVIVKDCPWPIHTVWELIQYTKIQKKTSHVLGSVFMDKDPVQKAFALVEYYLEHKDLHPNTRLSYEVRRSLMAAAAG